MKKSKKISLSLNKKVVSNFKSSRITGGDTLHTCAYECTVGGGLNTQSPKLCLSNQLIGGCNGD